MSEFKPENVQTWVELLRGFDQARGHFAESARHAMLGVSETLRVFQELAADPRAAEFGGPGAVSMLDLIRRGLIMWSERIPGLLDASNLDVAKREALVTVKEVLLAEVTRIRERGEISNDDFIKIEALEAILRVVDMELDRQGHEEARQPAGAGPLRRVVIE